MSDTLDKLPDVLRALPTEPIGLAALVILVLAFLAYLVVRHTDTPSYRTIMLIIIVGSMGLAVWRLAIGRDALFRQFTGINFDIPAGATEEVTREPEGTVGYLFVNKGSVQFDVRIVNPHGHGWDAETVDPGKEKVVQKTSQHGGLVLAAKSSGNARGTYRRLN